MQTHRCGVRLGTTGLTRLIAASLGVLATNCLVSERCYLDEDCPEQEICSASGACVFECASDLDCDDRFGVEFDCVAGHCQRNPACTTCAFPNAEHSCVHGDCQMSACQPGFFDRDGEPENGCEFRCEPGTFDANGDPEDGCECTPSSTGIERCNGRDDDCDGRIDEDFDLMTDVAHCGECNRSCAAGPNATPVCDGGQCLYLCVAGYFDNDGRADNGCEAAACVPSVERCNGRDDDCDCPGDTNDDGILCGPGDEGVDEGFDKTTVDACGPYCAVCSFPQATAACVDGTCQLAACHPDHHDLDDNPANGCEYACVFGGDEQCNGRDDDCDGLIDEGCLAVCPPEMVAIGTAYCIDRYEASRGDASATSQGVETAQAYSRPDVLPWMVNPMTAAHLPQFEAACAAAGKHLCTKDEWFAACAGPALSPFVYGDVFDAETCNCVDTFCDDYCAAQGLASCMTGNDCGYLYYCFEEMPTGSFPACTNDYGTFDINGNV